MGVALGGVARIPLIQDILQLLKTNDSSENPTVFSWISSIKTGLFEWHSHLNLKKRYTKLYIYERVTFSEVNFSKATSLVSFNGKFKKNLFPPPNLLQPSLQRFDAFKNAKCEKKKTPTQTNVKNHPFPTANTNKNVKQTPSPPKKKKQKTYPPGKEKTYPTRKGSSEYHRLQNVVWEGIC